MALSHTVVFLVLVAGCFAEVANFLPCTDEPTEYCTVTEVRISPCKRPNKCLITKGQNASISFDFTPKFAATKLITKVSWPAAPGGEKAFGELDDYEACGLTTCPTVDGASQTFNYNLYLGKKLPKGSYEIKWVVRNEENRQQNCCFLTTIELKKSKEKKK